MDCKKYSYLLVKVNAKLLLLNLGKRKEKKTRGFIEIYGFSDLFNFNDC